MLEGGSRSRDRERGRHIRAGRDLDEVRMLETLPACETLTRLVLEQVCDAVHELMGDMRLEKRIDVDGRRLSREDRFG